MRGKPPGSEHDTFATLLIDHHYEINGISKGWEREQVYRLAQQLHCTEFELGKLCGVDFATMKRFLNKNKFPPYISLHFALLDAWFRSEVQGSELVPVMPVNLILTK